MPDQIPEEMSNNIRAEEISEIAQWRSLKLCEYT